MEWKCLISEKTKFNNSVVLGSFVFAIQILFVLFISALHQKTIDLILIWQYLADHWDSGWYASIAENGYFLKSLPVLDPHTGNNNVTFLPGYPYLARYLFLLTKIDIRYALLIVAQSAAWIFWCFLFHILKKIEFKKKLLAATLIAVFPSSWFLYVGYSESLFLVLCCLSIYFSTEKKWIFSGIFGFFMTLTRMFGVATLVAPILSLVVTRLYNQKSKRNIYSIFKIIFQNWRAILAIVISSLGFLSFLAYCQFKFHVWNIYFKNEELGWSATANFKILFNPKFWIPYGTLGRISNGIFAIFSFFVILNIILKKRCEHYKSFTWLLAAFFLYFISFTGSSNRYYDSMTRFLLPVWSLFVIADALHPRHLLFFNVSKNRILRFILPLIIIVFIFLWIDLLNKFFK